MYTFLDSCSIHTLAHLLELPSVLCHSAFLVVIISACLSSMLSSLKCTSSPSLYRFPACLNPIVFYPIFGVGYCGRVIKCPPANASSPSTPSLLDWPAKPKPPHSFPPPQHISASMGSYQPAFLKRPPSNSSLKTQVSSPALRSTPTMVTATLLPAPAPHPVASTVLAIVFTPLSS